MIEISRIQPVAPYRLDLTVWALRRRPDNVVDRWDGKTYRRAFVVNERVIEVAVNQEGDPEEPALVILTDQNCASDEKIQITTRLTKMLGIEKDLSEFYKLAKRDKALGPLARKFMGLKPPRLASLYEALLNGFTCQQLSLTACIAILNRLVLKYGPRLSPIDKDVHAFPRVADLASLNVTDFRKAGYSGAKGRAIVELSRAIAGGDLNLNSIESLDNRSALDALVALRGVGRWTAEFVLLRGLGRIEIFPGNDVGAQNKLKSWLSLAQPPNYEETFRIIKKWYPFAGLVYFHLLLNSLAESGYLDLAAQPD